MSNVPVAVVTGSNKGIGFAIVRALCKQFQGDVYLTARDPGRGQEAVAKLQEEGLHALFHQLDIDDLQSIRALRDFLKEKYGGLDVLVNNAGIAFKGRPIPDSPLPMCYKAMWRKIVGASSILQSYLYGTSVPVTLLLFWLGKLPTFLSMMRGQCEMALPLASVGLTVHVKMLPWSIAFASHTEHENT